MLMFLGEIFAGLIFYFFHEKYLLKKKKSKLFESINIGYRAKRKLKIDNNRIIKFLIIVSAFCDFAQFTLFDGIYKLIAILGSFESRIRGTFTLSTALFYHYFNSYSNFP